MKRLSQIKREFTELERRVQKLKIIETKLNSLDVGDFKSDAMDIILKLKDLDSIDNVETEFILLKKKIDNRIEREKKLFEKKERRRKEREQARARAKEISMENLYFILGVNNSADSYEILGVSRFASKKEIDKAYKKKQLDWHPDRFKTDRGKELGNEVSKLLNSARYKIYERKGW